MYWIASPTVTIFSASSSGIWMSKCSSSAITSSTVSRESAPRSSMNFAVGVTSSSSTPSCSTMISFTFSSTGFAMNRSPPPKGELHIETAVDVVHLAGVAHRPSSRCDVDDAAAALLSDQHLRDGARHQERAAEVHLDHPIPVLILHPHEQLIVRDAGVVDEDIDTSELLSRRAHEAIAIVTTHHVGDDAERRVSLRFQVLHHPLQSVAVAPRDYHGRAVVGQPRADRGADPAPATGDDRDLALQRTLHAPTPTAARARSTPAGSSTDWPRAPLTMRRTSPLSTRPGSTSTYAVATSPACR